MGDCDKVDESQTRSGMDCEMPEAKTAKVAQKNGKKECRKDTPMQRAKKADQDSSKLQSTSRHLHARLKKSQDRVSLCAIYDPWLPGQGTCSCV